MHGQNVNVLLHFYAATVGLYGGRYFAYIE